MLEYLSHFGKILVSGPQRSGTRLMSKILAHDFGYIYVDEEDLGIDSVARMRQSLALPFKMVFQCPALCYCIETFSAPDIAIVYMERSTEDIIASEKRIGWNDNTEREHYNAGDVDMPIAEIKWLWWEKIQREMIHNPFTIVYGYLSQHPLWIPKEERVNFKWNQTERGE